ncbi:MAG: hypothetical protein AAF270_12150 [Pseudomonadota bacterium]
MTARFLEISVASDDLLASLDFYHTLGFTELTTGDALDYGYAVVAGPQISIGLHAQHVERPTVTLVLPDLAHTALQWSDNEFVQNMRIDQDTFNQVDLVDHDDHALRLIEARTFSPSSEKISMALPGRLLEYTLPVRDALASAQFWAPWTQQSLGVQEEPKLHMRLEMAGLPVGLSEVATGRVPRLSYAVDDIAALGMALDHLGAPLKPCGIGLRGCAGRLVSPEGLEFAFFQEDFLD